MASVSVFAFADKEGIVSEMDKYVDELAMINSKEEKVILDLIHDVHVKKEEEIYSFENPAIVKENIKILKALGLSFMLAKNPKETDNGTNLKEIFCKDE